MEEKEPEKAKLNIQLDKDLLDKGKGLAKRRGISLGGLLRLLLIRELEEELNKK